MEKDYDIILFRNHLASDIDLLGSLVLAKLHFIKAAFRRAHTETLLFLFAKKERNYDQPYCFI